MYNIGDIFYLDSDYQNKVKFCNDNKLVIKEIEKDIKGNRQFKICEYQIDELDEAKVELENLKIWFNEYYTQHEQKYRRLITLNKVDDDDIDGQTKLITLYEEAEQKRARIQELESRIQKLELKKALSPNS